MPEGGALIVGSYELLVRGLEELLSQAGIPLLGRAHDLAEARSLIQTLLPRLIIATVEEPSTLPSILTALLTAVDGDVEILLVSVGDASGLLVTRRVVTRVTPEILHALAVAEPTPSS